MFNYVSSEGSGGEEEGESEEEVEEEGKIVKRKKKHRKKSMHALPPEKVAELRAKIEAEREKLQQKTDLAEEERNQAAEELEKREKDIKDSEMEHVRLQEKLKAVESKIIVGGVNLLEKAKEQELLLEQSAKELSARKEREKELQKLIEEKEQERIDIEEKYASLQEEAAGKTKKLKKVWSMLKSAESEMADQQQEHQRETEGLLESIRELRKELQFETKLIESFIPPEFQDLIEQHVSWNEELGEWQLKFVAYSGNNMRKASPSPDPKDKSKELNETDLSSVYLTYEHINYAMGYDEPTARPKSSRPKSSRPKTAGRPKTGKKKKSEGEEVVNKKKEDDTQKYPQSRRLLSPKKHFA